MAVLILTLWISLICVGFSTAQVKWCVTSKSELAKCDSLKNYLADNEIAQLGCYEGDGSYDCWRHIKDGDADLIRVDDTDIYSAGLIYDLIPIAKETTSKDSNAETFLYKTVVVVKADGPIKSLDDLYGKKSCHTGVGKTAGWTIPVSWLIKKMILLSEDCDNTVKSVAGFFSQSCAPGALSPINNPYDDNPTNVCGICKDKLCPTDEYYGGYVGALKCLVEDVGEVAFVKHTTIEDAIGAGLTVSKESLRLLCGDGRIENVTEWNKCYWAARPTGVVMTSPSKSDIEISQMKTFLESLKDTADVSFFQSSDFGGKNLMFTDGTDHLIGIEKSKANYRTYLDPGYLTSMEFYNNCVSFRWCVKTPVEKNKCNDMRAALTSKQITTKMKCVDGVDTNDCIRRIGQGSADIMTLGADEVYNAGRYSHLVPISAENYKDIDEGTSYWAVAVVRKQNPGVNINNLKGTRSCHTGIMKQTGWVIPVGSLIGHGQMKKTDACNMAVNVGNFFKESCVPGALDSKYNPKGTNPKNLCALCGGETSCQRDASNKYYGYTGALRCLVEKNADVAFVKHTTVMDVVNGAESWSASLKSSDFEILCLDGSRRPVKDWATCNLARVSSQAVVTNQNAVEELRKHYQRILNRAQYYYNSQNPIFNFFQSQSGSKDVIFKDKTEKLSNIPFSKQDYKIWLEAEYLKALEEIDVSSCTN